MKKLKASKTLSVKNNTSHHCLRIESPALTVLGLDEMSAWDNVEQVVVWAMQSVLQWTDNATPGENQMNLFSMLNMSFPQLLQFPS